MISPAKLMNDVVGMPWKANGSLPEHGGMDCWGLVEYAHKQVFGIELPVPPWRSEINLDKSAKIAISDYKDDSARHGSIFAVSNSDGGLVHVGVILAGYALHAMGSQRQAGEVIAQTIPIMERRYKIAGYEVRYYRYKGMTDDNVKTAQERTKRKVRGR